MYIEEAMTNNILIGDRIVFDESYGTIRYVGEVGKNTGQWLGIEWDDEKRGKHNGLYDGKQYFKTKSTHGGSFVRLKKVDFGITCIEGIKERYGSAKEKEENFGIKEENLILPQAPGSQDRVIEVVGLKDICETQSKYDSLKVVLLCGMKINGAGPSGLLSKFSPCIMELDLSRNLISSWDKLASITKQLPHLKFLNITQNRMTLPTEPKNIIDAFKSVRQLIMQAMNYSWTEILRCLLLFPDIEYLSVAGNKIELISTPDKSLLNKLKEINLSFVNLRGWEEIVKLGLLPCLESMNVSNNRLTNVFFKDAEWNEKTKYFSRLNALSISNNNVLSWKDLAALNKLKNLRNLTIRNNPIINSYTIENMRVCLIARIGSLQVLNHSEISKNDRKGAELEYFKANGKKWIAASNDENLLKKFCEDNPRYPDLVSVFGELDPAELEEKSKSLKSNLIKVTIKTDQLVENKSITKNISITLTIKKLKALVQRLTKVDKIQNLQLFYKDTEGSNLEIPLDNDLRQLSIYSPENNSIIFARWKTDLR